MMSKWKWIRKACKTQGYIRSAKVALRIEKALKELYGNAKTKNTEALKEFQERNAFGDADYYCICNFAALSRFCIGCEMTTSCGCEECLFGKKYGFCDHESLYSEFTKTISKEHHQKENQIPSEEKK